MAEELGRIEKPEVEKFKEGRKLFYVPLPYGGQALGEEYSQKLEKYWKQVADQVADLTSKLGKVSHVYHELVGEAGEEGCKTAREINPAGYGVIQSSLDAGATMDALEDQDILSEFMDWSRCIYVGLQNPRVLEQVYNAYQEASKKRTEAMAGRLDESLAADEIGLVIMSENHQVRFPSDAQVFYVAPPALDEIKRWLRDQETAASQEAQNDAG